MADITSQARFLALKWKRGTGYYGAHKHDQPYSWRAFRHNMGPSAGCLDIAKRRYEAYVLSWVLFHKREPEAARLSERHGETILGRVREAVRTELAWQKEMSTAKPKGAKRTKRGKR